MGGRRRPGDEKERNGGAAHAGQLSVRRLLRPDEPGGQKRNDDGNTHHAQGERHARDIRRHREHKKPKDQQGPGSDS